GMDVDSGCTDPERLTEPLGPGYVLLRGARAGRSEHHRGVEDRVVLADRVHRLAAPPWRVYDALVSERDRWWARYDWEIAPVVVSAQATRVVWSSPWPVSAQDTIEFDLAPDADGPALRFVWRSERPPYERGANRVR